MKAIRTLLACIRKADQKYNLINHGDKIIIGLSGGKDSLALCYALNLYKKFSHTEFEIQPVTLDLGFDGFSREYLDKFCESIGLKLIVKDCKEVYKILKANQKQEHHLPCSICSKMKKAAINKAAKELGYNKVAFAHHADDAVETLFMNELYGGRIATFSPKMHLERADITFIRPFLLVRESDIKRFIKEENIFVPSSICPADKTTTREDVKQLLLKIYKDYPQSKENLLLMLDNYERFDIWDKEINMQVDNEGLYIKPVLTMEDTFKAVDIRKKTFMDEFNIPFEEEFVLEEEKDTKVYLIYKNENVIGTIRYRLLDNGVKLERFAIYKEYRHLGYGKKVISYLTDYLWAKYNPKPIYLNAMCSLINYYSSLGYVKEGEEFNDANIPHIKMVYNKGK